MPPPRQSLSPLYKGFICSSCRKSLQQPTYPPWLARSVSTRRINGKSRTRTPTEKPATQDSKPKMVIRHFDQMEDGQLRSIDDGDDVQLALEAKIKEIEKELASMTTRLSEASDGSSIANSLEMFRSYRQAERNFGESHSIQSESSVLEDEILTVHDPGYRLSSVQNSTPLQPTIPRDSFPKEAHVSIARLNEALRQAIELPTSAIARKLLWKWYSLNRNTLSTDWQAIPADVWTILWREFSVASNDNLERMAHVRRIGQDMESAGILMRSAQILLYIEAIFLDLSHESALSRWRSARPALTLDNSTAVRYWELGVKVLAIENQPKNAQEAADILLNTLEGERDARVLIHLIRAWLTSADGAALQKAWAIYVRMSYRLSSNMQMKDYEDVMKIFLEAEQADLALAVFRDMMLTGDAAAPMQNSVGTYRSVLKLDKPLNSFDFGAAEISWTSHKQFTVLPRKQRNKFFYGSWIKKLIGEGEINSAFQVAELMYQHGFRPDARYLNGIIGAWLRSGSISNRGKAEDLAWKMIATRLDFVRTRRYEYQLDDSMTLQLSHYGKDDFIRPVLAHAATMATSETFSVLAWHYQRLQNTESLQTLLTALSDSEIQPSTSFVNGLLAFGTASDKKHWKWTTFLKFAQEKGVLPDYETFELLWRVMKAHVDPVKNKKRTGFPSCRTLFAEMINYAPVLTKNEFPRPLYDRIILCFGLSDDQVGTAVALRAMQEYFKIYPNEATVRSVILQLAKARAQHVDGFMSRRLNLNRESMERIRELTGILKGLKDERVEALRRDGIEFEKLSEPALSEETLKLLSKMLCFVAESRIKQEDGGESLHGIADLGFLAAEQMGVPDCKPRTD